MNTRSVLTILFSLACLWGKAQQKTLAVTQFPLNNAKGVNPDTHLQLTFSEPPGLGNSGKIRIYDAATNQLVDSLDLAIPPGPTARDTSRAPMVTTPYEYLPGNFTNANTRPGTPSGGAVPTSDKYQLTIIGGFTDAFHFYPVIIHDRVATIYLHHNLLAYDKNYYVTIDPGVFSVPGGDFKIDRSGWKFSTKKAAPKSNQNLLTVSSDGSGDFNTVQGALDFVPGNGTQRVTIFIKKGTYEEIVYFRKKSKITIIGEDREKTVITYRNMEPFNPHPVNRGTNELPGTFPSRRAVFMADNCEEIYIANLSIKNPTVNQSEGLLITGERNVIYRVNNLGGGDALQVNGSAYFKECKLEGAGDAILGRGAAFFDQCDLYSRGPFMWIRNTPANHGNIFVNSTFHGTGTTPTDLARLPLNGGKTYPYSEAVLINCKLENITPQGWGRIDGNTEDIHYWEYNSTNLNDGKPIDASKRHPASRQLDQETDAEIIRKYSNPAFVLGWTPPLQDLLQALAKVR